MDSLQIGLGTLVLMLLLALAMGFTAAWQEAETAVTSVISTGALRPAQAVMFAAACNALGPLLHAPNISALIAVGLVDPTLTDATIVLAALATALSFAALAARTGWALNTMHAALGGLIGASIASGGLAGISLAGVGVLLAAALIAPAAGLVCAGLIWVGLAHTLRRSAPRSTDRFFKNAQWLTSGVFNLNRGNQHAQTGLGLIGLALITAGLATGERHLPAAVFTWIVALVVGAGTLAGGLALLKRRKLQLTRIRPVHACSADAAAAIVMSASSHWGIPVASTHLTTAATVGATESGSLGLKRWGIDAVVMAAALLSLPAAALVGAMFERLARVVFG